MRKKMYLIILSFVAFVNSHLYAQTLQDTLSSINYNYYIGKPIDSLLSILPQSYDNMYTSSTTSMFYGARIVVAYSNSDLWLYIYPSTSNYFNRLNSPTQPPSIAWPLDEVRKENLGRVTVVNLDLLPIIDVE